MRTENTKRTEKGTRKWWGPFGKVFAQKDKISFEPDGVVILAPKYGHILDCRYIWIERVTTSGLSEEKRYWLPKILSSEWLVVIHGKPNWKTGWESIRPETYDRKPPESEEGIYELLQIIKWGHTKFYKEKYEKLLNVKNASVQESQTRNLHSFRLRN
jgi:hypothetical protein